MQAISTALKNEVDQSHVLQVKPKLIAEWNHNEFVDNVTVTGTRPNYDADRFPLDSIILPRRPTTGIPFAFTDDTKARAAKATVDDSYPKFRTVGDDTKFTYWISGDKSNTSSPYDIATNEIRVDYGAQRKTNKIVATFETSIAKPDNVQIFVNTGSGDVSVGSWATNSNGQVVIYYQGAGSWSQTYNINNEANVQSIIIRVTSLNQPGVRYGVIEASARYVQDLTDDVASISISQVREDMNVALPTGLVQANSCDIELDNTTGRYDPQNTLSDLHGLIDENVKFTVSMDMHNGTSFENVQQGIFYANEWGIDSESATVSVNCHDFSKFVQKLMVPQSFYVSKTAKFIFRDLLERCGITNIKFNISNIDNEYEIPFVWYNEETSLWDALKDIAKAEQAVFYFDEQGVFTYDSKEYIFDNTVPDWELYAVPQGAILPNIQSLSYRFEVEANRVVIKYSPIHKNENPYGEAISSITWKQEDALALVASDLQQNITSGSTRIYIANSDVAFFPDEGYVNIEGEYIKYNGKGSNYLTIEQRGALGSKPYQKDHRIDLDGWGIAGYYGGGSHNGVLGERWNFKVAQIDGSMRVNSKRNNYNDYLHVRRGVGSDVYSVYGTKVLFPTHHTASRNLAQGELFPDPVYFGGEVDYDTNSIQEPVDYGNHHGMAGLIFHEGPGKAGYYVELVESGLANRMNIGNIRVYRQEYNGWRRGLPQTPEGIRGFDYPIVPNRWYQIDVTYDPDTRAINVYVDGQHITGFIDTYGSPKVQGNWGMFVRGDTVADFEYFYVNNHEDRNIAPDIERYRFQKRVMGGFGSGYALRERPRVVGSDWFFDEFGPIVHEARKFEVGYNIVPMIYSRLYSSNDWLAHEHSFVPTPFDAEFIVSNASRSIAVLSGNDESIYAGNTVQQQLFVYGQAVVKKEEKTFKVENEGSIRRRGPIEVEIVSPWIQREEQAFEIGDFITDRWGAPVDVIEIESILHPGLQVGDLVTVDYPDRNMDPSSHKYHVIERNIEFGGNFGCRLILRRAYV